jgi:hypothetical protein
MTITYAPEDIIRNDVPRTLPVELDDNEMLEIARAKAKKELAIEKLDADLKATTKAKRAIIEEQVKLVATMTEELATGKQMRQVLTDEVMHKGMVHTIRQDTFEVVEKRQPTLMERQRDLPNTTASTSEASAFNADGSFNEAAAATIEEDGDPTASKRAKPPSKPKKSGGKSKSKKGSK